MKPGTKESSIEFDRQHIWHPFTSLAQDVNPIHVVSGKGVYLETVDGRRIIDAISSWWVNLHGHSHPAIASAIYEQALKLEHVIFAGFTHEPAIRLAKNLLTVLPKNQHRLFFSDNGSTAVEVALKMALQFFYNQDQSRKKIIALNGAYHGDTFGSMSVASRSAFTAPFNDHLFEVEFIDAPNAQNGTDVLQAFSRLVSTQDVAAFIYEPLVQGANGMTMYPGESLRELIQIAKAKGTLCIADEVFTGFGRTGKWFASEYVDIAPDIMAVSKGITGGTLPLGVTSCSAEVAKAFDSPEAKHTFFHGHSYTANPIACAAANASFSILSSGETWEAIRKIERLHRDFVRKITAHPAVKEARCLGTILAVELTTNEGTSYFNSIKKKIYEFFLSKNILLRPLGNVIYILPPYVISENELEIIYDAIADFLDQIKPDLG